MSREGADLPQDVHERLVGQKKSHSDISNSDSVEPWKTKVGSKLEKPSVVIGADVNTRIREKGKKSTAEGEGGTAAADATAGSVVSARGGWRKGKAFAEMEHQLHIWTERERRKKMKNTYSALHALIPHLPDKADKISIVEGTIGYIRTLEDVIKNLERLKMERACAQQGAAANFGEASTQAARRLATEADMGNGLMNAPLQAAAEVTAAPATALQTWAAPNITLTMAGDVDAFINMCLPRKKASLTTVLFVLERNRIDVVTSTISSDQQGKTLFNIHVRINEASSHCTTKNLKPEAKYKLAVSELMIRLAE
ncbi:hypothetical protein GUJ93_ZPchr0004g40014 [Zizania palustris]|uniref:BHLH domain-containing protein n=1 Tax=Zizania palustris TaxID=103762 RepID=A0A8J5SYZ7_ZIZPA|nr:hypothetical protein GUJ93_ZPchr0004g40014 [Zizania palustris]